MDRMPPDKVGCASSARLAAAMFEFRASGLPAADDGLTGGETAPFAAVTRPQMNAVQNAKIVTSARAAACAQESAVRMNSRSAAISCAYQPCDRI